MTEQKKRTRAPKKMPATDILQQIGYLDLKEKVAVFTALKGMIQADQKAMQEQLELINANVK
jgi:hypothetical protein